MAVVSAAAPGGWGVFAPVDRFVRFIVTAVSFAIFGIVGLVMALLVFPAYRVFIRDRQKRAAIAQASVHGVWWFYVRLMRTLGGLTFECDHPEVLRDLTGTIVVANHPSLLDVVFLMSFMRRTRAVVKAGVWRNPFMAGVVKAADYIPNLDDPEKLLADCGGALKAGANLMIFPEGSRTPEGQPRKYQKGFARVALAVGAPVQIVTIRVTPPTLRKGEPWWKIPASRPHWAIRVHERIDTAGQYGNDPTPAAVRRLSMDVAERIEGLLRQ